MSNPWISVDLRNHPLYSNVDYYHQYAKVWKAEVLMINTNKGSLRVRLFHEDGEPFVKNFETSYEYVLEDNFQVRVR